MEPVEKKNIDNTCKKSGGRNHLLEKFNKLKERREALTKRSTEKRVKDLQEDVLKKVKEEFVQEKDINILEESGVDLNVTQNKRRKIEIKGQASTSTQGTNTWKDVKPFLTCNDHLKGLDKGKYAPKTQLEEEIDDCISKKDFKKAEELSDKLATRDFGKKIADAFDAKEFVNNVKQNDLEKKKRKKTKLNWGFEQKYRWETKSNM